MSEEDAFLVDILAQPHDRTARLVYSDWLEERDDPRAEWVRRGLEVALPDIDAVEPSKEEMLFRGELQQGLPGQREYLGLPLNWDQLTTVFLYRLAEAITWSKPRFRPHRIDDEVTRQVPPQDPKLNFFGMPVEVCHHRSRRLAVTRSRLLAEAGQSPREPARSLEGGRMLLIAYRQALPMNEANNLLPRSDGFLGYHTGPPLGAWVARVKEDDQPLGQPQFFHYVAAYVPPALLNSVNAAMADQPKGMEGRTLTWSKRVPASLLVRCRERGVAL